MIGRRSVLGPVLMLLVGLLGATFVWTDRLASLLGYPGVGLLCVVLLSAVIALWPRYIVQRARPARARHLNEGA